MSEPTPSPTAATTTPSPDGDRQALRQRLLQARRSWADSPAFAGAHARVHARLMEVLAQLEPSCLGVYWPLSGEFNPREAAAQAKALWGCRLALPFAQKTPRQMHFAAWDSTEPTLRDGCGLPTSAGEPVVPDVLLVPCVGFTEDGHRLGYGGGYFDRFLAAHPEVTAIGLGWELGRLTAAQLQPAEHDQPLVGVLTESDT
jgi:5-formyltetrahydrofolate cyclo-ligase